MSLLFYFVSDYQGLQLTSILGNAHQLCDWSVWPSAGENHVTPAAQARGVASEAVAVWTNAALWWNYDVNVCWRQGSMNNTAIMWLFAQTATNLFLLRTHWRKEMTRFGFGILKSTKGFVDCLIPHGKKSHMARNNFVDCSSTNFSQSCVVS